MHEYIGILGSIIIVLAFAMKQEKYIRIFDMVGAALFVVYGILIHSFSNVFLNSVLILINVYRLYKKEKISG